MRFLPTGVHGVIDYLWGLALLATPWVFGFADVSAATWLAIVFGIGAILYSALTAYELGLLKILPMPMHLILDGIGGIVLAASPWLFGFADQVFWPHLLFGLFSVVASLVTRLEPTLITGHREPARYPECLIDGTPGEAQHHGFSREATMFENVVQASEAYRASAHHMQGSLRMALKGCPECRTTQMIASPSLGTCDDCGSNLVVLPRE